MRLILASSSPRRRELLRAAGFHFEVQSASIQEQRRPSESGVEFARRTAREKALHVAASAPRGSLVLGADTVVLVDARVLEKPADPADAAAMLRLLSGKTHEVVTAVCFVRPPDHVECLRNETTGVTFRKLDEGEIAEYVASGEPDDKAGAYGIQGLASKFVTRVEGDYTNVVGLPVALVYDVLKPLLQAGEIR